MDVRVYFEKIRQVQATIEPPYVLVNSLETPDGGIPGTVSEVTRHMAAKLIVEHRARLATNQEIVSFQENAEQIRRSTEEQIASSRVQVSLISESDLREIRARRQK